MPFDDSRRLTGSNLFFAVPGAVLDLAGVPPDDALIAGWRERVARARAYLGWPPQGSGSGPLDPGAVVVRPHARGASLAIAAPFDVLMTATEVNEWALCATLATRDPLHWAALEDALLAAATEAASGVAPTDPPRLDEAAACGRFRRLADAEARPAARELVAAAAARGVPCVLDETELTLGVGARSSTWSLEALPPPGSVPWARLGPVPVALVTGSNGKTTTVRLVAACAREQGWQTGYNCTDGVRVGDAVVAVGDYAGPVGARTVLRDRRVEAAVIETARGGILRRGIAVEGARAAVVTNVSSDHFGEYGIDDLAGLADVKLTVGAVLEPGGLLVLNADDATLAGRAPGLAARYGRETRIGWFALDADAPTLVAHRARGGWTCGVRGGVLELHSGGGVHDLGRVAAMPVTADGSAIYNVANLAASALAAAALGVEPAAIARVYARFGADPNDNPGRLMRYDVRGTAVIVDYAHNPEGLAGLMAVARHLRPAGGRLGVLLGHAGNRRDADFEAVARVVAAAGPDLVVVKEDESHLRGREPGEIPRILRAALITHGLPEASIALRMSELDAVRCALDWARPGDLLVLPVHSAAARTATIELLAERGA